MCWYMKVSVPLMYNLGRRAGEQVVDFFYRLVHRLTDVIAGTWQCLAKKGYNRTEKLFLFDCSLSWESVMESSLRFLKLYGFIS